MAITWGSATSWQTYGKVYSGIDFVKVSGNDTSEVWRFVGYVKVYGALSGVNFSYSLSGAWGSASGSKSITKSGTSTEAYFEVFRKDVTFTKTASSQSKSATFNVSSNYTGSASHTRSMSLPAYTTYAPNVPLNVFAIYTGTNQGLVKWTGNATPSKPVTGYEVQQLNEGGSWTTVSNMTGTQATFNSAAGTRSKWRVRAKNAKGVSAWVETGWVSMSPLAPTGVQAVKSDSVIKVSWSNPNKNPDVRFEIWDATTLQASNINGTSFNIAAPTSGNAVTYRVRAVAGGRYSGFASAPPVTILQPPAQPSNLTPLGFSPVGAKIRFEWRHNPLDGTSQTGFELQYRSSSTTAWTTVTGGSSEYYEVASGVPVAVGVVEYRVRTKGAHADYSPYSEISSYEVVARPTVTVNAPTRANTDNFSIVVSSNQAGSIGIQVLVEVLAGAVVEDSWEVKAFQSTPANILIEPVPTGKTVRTTTIVTGKVESLPVVKTTTVTYASPAAPLFTATWTDTASVTYTVSANNGAVATVATAVEVSVNHGAWKKIADFPLTGGGVDPIPSLIAESLRYRGVAVSDLGTKTYSAPVELGKYGTPGLYLNWGEGFTGFVFAEHNPQIKADISYVNEARYVFAGQELPSVIRGKALARAFSLSWQILPKVNGREPDLAELEKIDALAEAGVVCLRSFDSPPRFGVVNGVQKTALRGFSYQISMNFIESQR